MFPTGDPAGTVATHTAGLLEFSATLSWNRLEDLPQAPTLPPCPETDVPSSRRMTPRRAGVKSWARYWPSPNGTSARPCRRLALLTISAALSDAVLEPGQPRHALPRPRPPPCRPWHSTFGTPASASVRPILDSGAGRGGRPRNTRSRTGTRELHRGSPVLESP